MLQSEASGRKKGFSLLEVVTSIAIFALVSAGLVGIFSQGNLAQKNSMKTSMACNLAREQLENVTWSTSSSSENYGSIPLYLGFRRVTSVSFLGVELKQITVSVYWDSDARVLTFMTYKCNY